MMLVALAWLGCAQPAPAPAEPSALLLDTLVTLEGGRRERWLLLTDIAQQMQDAHGVAVRVSGPLNWLLQTHTDVALRSVPAREAVAAVLEDDERFVSWSLRYGRSTDAFVLNVHAVLWEPRRFSDPDRYIDEAIEAGWPPEAFGR